MKPVHVLSQLSMLLTAILMSSAAVCHLEKKRAKALVSTVQHHILLPTRQLTVNTDDSSPTIT